MANAGSSPACSNEVKNKMRISICQGVGHALIGFGIVCSIVGMYGDVYALLVSGMMVIVIGGILCGMEE